MKLHLYMGIESQCICCGSKVKSFIHCNHMTTCQIQAYRLQIYDNLLNLIGPKDSDLTQLFQFDLCHLLNAKVLAVDYIHLSISDWQPAIAIPLLNCFGLFVLFIVSIFLLEDINNIAWVLIILRPWKHTKICHFSRDEMCIYLFNVVLNLHQR